jgi:peroxiredoxin
MNSILVCVMTFLLLGSPTENQVAPVPGPSLRIPNLSDKAIADFTSAMADADAAISSKRPERAMRAYRRAAGLHSTNEGLWYNLACTHALAGQVDDALEALRNASAAGWSDPKWPTQDSDLATLHELPAFEEWLASLAKPAASDQLDVGALAPDAESISKLADEAGARLDRVKPVMGSTETARETRRIAQWRARSWDRVAATREGAARSEADMEALSALTRKDYRPRSPEFADDVARRAMAFAQSHAGSPLVASAELMAAYAWHESAMARAAARDASEANDDGNEDATDGNEDAEDELDADDIEEALEHRLLVLAASHDDGPAVRAALVKLLSTSTDPRASRTLYGRLARLMPDDAERKALVMGGARATWYRMEGLPAFDARTLDGHVLNNDTLKGKVTLIDFWATWCGPCKVELPHIKVAWERFQGDDFQILGVSLDKAKDGDPAAFQKWCDDNGVTWPQVFDGKHWEAALAKTFGVKSIPFPLLVDREGNVVAADEALRGDDLVVAIEAALSTPAAGDP